MPPDPDPNNPRMPRGHASEERVVQEEREQTALSAVYMTPTQIPDSPAEPSTVLPEEESDKDAKVMLLGDEMDALFYPAADSSMSMNIDSNLNVSQLIGQLSTGISNAIDASSHQAPVLDLSSMAAVHSLRPEQVHQLLSQISSTMGVAGQQQQDQYGHFGSAAGGGNEAASTWASSATPHHFSDYNQMYSDDSDKSRWEDRNGRGGRGLGSRGSRGKSDDWGGKPYPSRKSRPCVFFQQQRRALILNLMSHEKDGLISHNELTDVNTATSAISYTSSFPLVIGKVPAELQSSLRYTLSLLAYPERLINNTSSPPIFRRSPLYIDTTVDILIFPKRGFKMSYNLDIGYEQLADIPERMGMVVTSLMHILTKITHVKI
jgi:hypothetical protein